MATTKVFAIALAGTLLAGSPMLFAQARTDAQIQADVNSKLEADPQLSGVAVGVLVKSGEVTLTGNVATEQQLDQAENDISDIQGISKIIDNMQVNATAPATTAPAGATNEAAATVGNAPPPPGDGQAGPPPAMPPAGEEEEANGGSQGSGYGPQGGPQPDYNQQRPRPRQVRYDPGNRQVTLPMGSVLTIRTIQPLQAGVTPDGAIFKGVVGMDVMGDQGVAIPRGTAVTGQVVESKKAGYFKGAAVLKLKLTSLTLGAQTLDLPTDVWGEKSAGKGGSTAGNAVGGAAFGALLGAVVGGGEGAAIGAGAGAVGGAASNGLSGRPQAYVPAEGLVTFRLTAPITVTTVPPSEARLLANAAPPLPQPRRPMPPPPGYYRPYPYPY